MRVIAHFFSVHQSTLSERLSGLSRSRTTAHEHEQVLTVQEELCLVSHIRQAALAGQPTSPALIYDVANELRHNRALLTSPSPSSIPPLGKHWLKNYKLRHPAVISAWTRTLEATRFAANTADRLKPWFDQIRLMMDTHHYPPSLVFNMDETGYAMGTTQSTRALFVVDRRDGEGVEGQRRGGRRSRPRLPRVDRNG